MNQIPVSATPIPQYAQAQYTTTTTINPSATYVPPQIIQSNNQMTVTIPENCPPGSLLTLLTPQGTTITITCPNDVKPGSVITVSY